MTATIAEHVSGNKSGKGVVVGFNNKMDAQEAANVLGCSYSYIIQLIDKKKLKAQRIKGTRKWMLDADDVYSAKSSGLLSQPRKNSKVRSVAIPAEKQPQPTDQTKIQVEIDKATFELLNTVLSNKGKTIKSFILDHVNEAANKVKESLNQVTL